MSVKEIVVGETVAARGYSLWRLALYGAFVLGSGGRARQAFDYRSPDYPTGRYDRCAALEIQKNPEPAVVAAAAVIGLVVYPLIRSQG